MAPANNNQRKKGKGIAELLKNCHIVKVAGESTPKGTTITPLLDSKMLAKWPKMNIKVPPIFLHTPVDIKTLIPSLIKMGFQFYLPVLGAYYVKISFPTLAGHRAMASYFNQNNLPYHTYGFPSKRKMKVMIRGLPRNTDLYVVKDELKSLGVPVIRIHKLQTKVEGRNMIAMVVVPHAEEGHKMLQVTKILGHAVTLEPPQEKVKQCHRCQKWGHCQRYCHALVKCVKCAGDHFTTKCTKDAVTPPKCANCSGEHTANFRGCPHCPDSEEHKTTLKRKLSLMRHINVKKQIATIDYVSVLSESFLLEEECGVTSC